MKIANYKKIDLINDLSKNTGLSKSCSKKLINDFLEILLLNLKKDSFILKNFGSFKIIKKNERKGRNPLTKEEYIISARKSLSFIPSNKLKYEIY